VDPLSGLGDQGAQLVFEVLSEEGALHEGIARGPLTLFLKPAHKVERFVAIGAHSRGPDVQKMAAMRCRVGGTAPHGTVTLDEKYPEPVRGLAPQEVDRRQGSTCPTTDDRHGRKVTIHEAKL
jgi:hypothetical protein